MNKNISDIGILCVGCRSCEQVCSIGSIFFISNKEGFLYPKVDSDKCIECGLCLKHCPIEKNRKGKMPNAVYGLKNKNKNRIKQSASGGVSDLVAQYILEQNGCVFGCAYDENHRVHHIEVSNKDNLWKIQSSKYVQSDLTFCYSKIKERLEQGKDILFTGTPCQVAGLYSYMGRDEIDGLYTIDLICHGVPSPLFFKKYIEFEEKKLGERIENYNFRFKGKKGWGTQYQLKIDTKSQSQIKKMALDKYGKHFLAGDCYRESCYRCKYANIFRMGDISCGDFWGIEKEEPNFNDVNGVSLVLVNSLKGEYLYKSIRRYVYEVDVSLEKILPYQGNLKKPTGRPAERDTFYKDINSDDFIQKIKVGLQLKGLSHFCRER